MLHVDQGSGPWPEQERAELHPAVLAAARRGDPQAFTEVLMHHDRQLRLLAFRLLGDQHQMEDALQDAAIRAFRALPRFDGRSALGTWLHRIVYTTCVDHLRRRPAQTPARARRPPRTSPTRPPTRSTAWSRGRAWRLPWTSSRRTSASPCSSSTRRATTTRRRARSSASRRGR